MEGYHVTGHGVRPFQDLRSDVDEKSIRCPASKNHDPFGRMVHEKQSHGGSRADAAVAYFRWAKAEGFLSAIEATCITYQVEGISAG